MIIIFLNPECASFTEHALSHMCSIRSGGFSFLFLKTQHNVILNFKTDSASLIGLETCTEHLLGTVLIFSITKVGKRICLTSYINFIITFRKIQGVGSQLRICWGQWSQVWGPKKQDGEALSNTFQGSLEGEPSSLPPFPTISFKRL